MAELTPPRPSRPSRRSCCSTAAQAACCEPSEKAACCETGAAGGTCGCAAGPTTATTTVAAGIRETVREKYAAAARAAAGAEGWCCDADRRGGVGEQAFGPALYGDEAAGAPGAAVNASLGCGVPTTVADLHEGETVLDLGSGAGADVLISARRVGATGKAIGLDMTDEMLDARARERRRGRRRERRVRQGLHRGHPAARRLGRRGDLQLRDQPRRRQAQGARRGRAGPAARRPVRGLRRHRRRGHGRGHARGHGRLDRLHRRRADRGASSAPRWPRPGSRTSRSARPTACTTSAGSAIVRARKPAG